MFSWIVGCNPGWRSMRRLSVHVGSCNRGNGGGIMFSWIVGCNPGWRSMRRLSGHVGSWSSLSWNTHTLTLYWMEGVSTRFLFLKLDNFTRNRGTAYGNLRLQVKRPNYCKEFCILIQLLLF